MPQRARPLITPMKGPVVINGDAGVTRDDESERRMWCTICYAIPSAGRCCVHRQVHRLGPRVHRPGDVRRSEHHLRSDLTSDWTFLHRIHPRRSAHQLDAAATLRGSTVDSTHLLPPGDPCWPTPPRVFGASHVLTITSVSNNVLALS